MEFISILDISQLEKSGGKRDFFVSELAHHIRINKSKITHPHKHNSYLTILFTKGFGWHEIDFERYEVRSGSVFFVSPGQTHHWKLSEDVEGYIFSHTTTFYNLYYSHHKITDFPFYFSTQNSPLLYLQEREVAKINEYFAQFFAESQSAKAFSDTIIYSQMTLIYSFLSQIYLQKNSGKILKPNASSNLLQRFENLLDEHYATLKLASEYAEKLHVTSKHLNRVVKNLLGKTVTEKISERIILEAKRQILHTNLPLTDIAESLGFNDYTYFSKLFKKTTGLTPTAFLKSYSVR